jgi:hypothetical protein
VIPEQDPSQADPDDDGGDLEAESEEELGRDDEASVSNRSTVSFVAIFCASPPPRPFIFPTVLFLVLHPVNRDDRHLLASAMASDF